MKGNSVICPICNSSFKEFGSFGVITRSNAKCLYCDSLERHRLLWKYLHEQSDLFSGRALSLLHFAPEPCYYEIFDGLKSISYFPCDLYPELYELDGRARIQKIDITQIPFPAESVDVILCNHVLEHIPDDSQAMRELHRVLKKGGWAILQVPIDNMRETTYEDNSITDPEKREKAFGQSDHVRIYGNDYVSRLEGAGFAVKVDDYARRLPPEDAKKFGIMQSEIIYRCFRP
jgi:predicted SAM-dependent methyltransferase